MKINFKRIIREKDKNFQIAVDSAFIKKYMISWLIERCERGATGGVRGLIDKKDFRRGQFNIGVVIFWAQAYSNYLKKYFQKQKQGIFLGFDTRYHSSTFGEAITRVLIGNNIGVIRDTKPDQPTSTAIVTHLASLRKLCGGVIITASHNPANQNGIKTSNFYGGLETDDASEKILFEIKKLYQAGGIIRIGGLADSKNLIFIDAPAEYHKNYLKKIFTRKDLVFVKRSLSKGFAFVIDGLGGVGGKTMEYFLGNFFGSFPWRKSIKIINKDYDPEMLGIYFPDPTNPQVLVESGLIPKLRELRANIGGTGDADWDRFGLVVSLKKNQAERARKFGLHVSIVSGLPIVRFQPDQLFSLLSYFRVSKLLKRRRKEKWYSFSTFASSHLAEELAEQFNIKIRYSSVGFKYLGRLMHKLEQEAKGRLVLVNAQEESGGNQVGYLTGRDSSGSLGNKNKDTTTLLLMIMRIGAELFLEGKNLADLYFDLVEELKVINFYERLDIYLPKPDPKNKISEKRKLASERKRAKLADSLEERPEIVAKLLGNELTPSKPKEYILKTGRLFEKVAADGRVLWRRIYKKGGEVSPFLAKGKWIDAAVKVKNYSLVNGANFSVYHIGEGPRIELYDKNKNLIAWIGFRPSGTEAGLLRIYIEILDRNLQNPNPFSMVSFASPFLKYLGLRHWVENLDKRLKEKYQFN